MAEDHGELQARQGVTLRATVLLSGPVGSGKKTAIVRAAEEIGVRAIPFSCQELRAGSDPKTALALKMGFNEAKAFAPAIMLLTDVEALVDKSPASECLSLDWTKHVYLVNDIPSIRNTFSTTRRSTCHTLKILFPSLATPPLPTPY